MRTRVRLAATLALGLLLGACTSQPRPQAAYAGPGLSAGDAFGLGMHATEREVVARAQAANTQANADQTPR